jgi:hypothetical protein
LDFLDRAAFSQALATDWAAITTMANGDGSFHAQGTGIEV